MSYIRSGSNPEGLYIYGTGRYVQVCAEGGLRDIPTHVFHGILKRWLRREENCRYRGASLTEAPDGTSWALRYTTWSEPVTMCKVTLYYIAKGNEERWT